MNDSLPAEPIRPRETTTMSMTNSPSLATLEEFGRRLLPHGQRLLTAEPWRSAGFLLLNLPLGLASFVVFLVAFVLSVGLSLSVVGLPLAFMVVLLWERAAKAERRRIARFFGDMIPAPYRVLPAGRWWTTRRAFLSDPAIWRDLGYLLLLFPVGLAEFVITAFALGLTVYWLTLPFTYLIGGTQFFGVWKIDTFAEALTGMIFGLILIPFGLALMIALGRAHVEFAKWRLGPSTKELEERVDVLTKSRSGVMEAMLMERRRIERDLHDGAQQRLVALAMDLGMAKEKFDSDPVAARQLIASSHDEAKRVLTDLRELVRGIHPAVLTDRGLDAAISAVAGRSPVPVTVDVHLNGRLPEAVESTAYFVVVEALTNVAKHGQATDAIVSVRRTPGWLIVEVLDNGAGGAAANNGGGLSGLADRLAALDGRLLVESPAGGPTRVRAEIPCGS
jgi:signal transduction histidine kinase